MKHLFNDLSNVEKQRILEMHQSATKKNYLSEQENFSSDFDNDDEEELIAPKLEDYGFPPYKVGEDMEGFKQRTLDFFGSPKCKEFEKAAERHSMRTQQINAKNYKPSDVHYLPDNMSDEEEIEYMMKNIKD